MSADLIFYIDKSKNPRANPILNLSSGTTDDSKLIFVAGDKLDIGVVFVNGTDIDTTMANGSNPKNLTLSVGTVGLDAPTATVSNWYLSSSYGYTGSLDLLEFTSSVGTDPYIEPTMQLVVTGSSGTKQTYMLRKVTVLNPVDVV